MGIALREISKRYNGRTVLQNFNLEVKRGGFHVLLGPSGGGKTTVLSLIAGLIKQDAGDIFIGHREVSCLPPEKRGIGFVFQNYALFPHLTAFGNAAYGLRARGVKNSIINQKVNYYLRKVGIESEKDKFPHQLSGGQRQKVALIRALVTEPEILLMDEPMSSLDAPTREKIGDELKTIQQEMQLTTVYVTHNRNEAVLLGDRVSVLNQGKIEQIGTADEIFHHPKTEFVSLFVGAKNIFKTTVAEIREEEVLLEVNNEGLHRPFQILVKKYPIFGKVKNMSMCLQPERIRIEAEHELTDMICAQSPVKLNMIKGNMIKGRIVHIIPHLITYEVTIDLGGLELYAIIPENSFRSKLYEQVWVCFNTDAPHPLCGKSCKDPTPQRKCFNNVT